MFRSSIGLSVRFSTKINIIKLTMATKKHARITGLVYFIVSPSMIAINKVITAAEKSRKPFISGNFIFSYFSSGRNFMQKINAIIPIGTFI